MFTFSERPNTEAINIREVVPKNKRAERSKMLHILSNKKLRYFHNQFINSTRPVLFENIKNGKLFGHTDNYIQIQINGEPELINTISPVKLESNYGSFMDGFIK